MTSLLALLRQNRNYRYTWLGQIVSETGDYFNNVAVFALVMEKSGSGLVVSGVMLARAVPAMLAGPVAGVLLDRLDRRRIMIASDLVRAVIALGFHPHHPSAASLAALSAERAADVRLSFFHQRARGNSSHHRHRRGIAYRQLAHPDYAMGHADGWYAAGRSKRRPVRIWPGLPDQFAIVRLLRLGHLAIHVPGGFRAGAAPPRASAPGMNTAKGLVYMSSVPLMMGIGMISAGWAMGGGAAQILFALFGEQVFHRGAAGIGSIWGFAGIGLLLGGHRTLRRTARELRRDTSARSLSPTSRMVFAYMLFSQADLFGWPWSA